MHHARLVEGMRHTFLPPFQNHTRCRYHRHVNCTRLLSWRFQEETVTPAGNLSSTNPSYSSPALGDPVQSQIEATLASINLNFSGLKPAFLDSLQVQQAPPIPLFPHQYQTKLSIACLCTTSSSLSPDTPNAVGEHTDGSLGQVAEHDKSSPLDLSRPPSNNIPNLAGGYAENALIRRWPTITPLILASQTTTGATGEPGDLFGSVTT
ncbi:hypothetical protein EDB89DRAFT_2229258 [Lactarius sanguifluus]|nr:hypothetical protein EDB89DRAFT_2229258 [Lactarius sanguifluus]